MSTFMLPNIWPWTNIINIINISDSDNKTGSNIKKQNTKTHDSTLMQSINRTMRLLTFFMVSLITYYLSFPNKNEISHWNNKLRVKYMSIIIIRDLMITLIFYSFWHWFLYQSKYSQKMKSFKFNKNYPPSNQIHKEQINTMIGTIINALIEILMIELYWTKNRNMLYFNFFKYPIWSIFWLLFIQYWRALHFYIAHRILHPWRFNICNIDIGKILYKYIHAVHHQSYNTNPWSGLSMHWIEHCLYFSCSLIPSLFIIQHPLHFLQNKIHAQLGPITGHDGFNSPGGGAHFHYLHHKYFEYNYGGSIIPFDQYFGTIHPLSK
eukprot:439168_1